MENSQHAGNIWKILLSLNENENVSHKIQQIMSMNTAVLKHELVRNLMFAPLVSKKFENDAILYNTGLMINIKIVL